MENKRGLVLIYNPHNFHQFVWYYCNEGKDLEWDVLCLPNDTKGEYMHSYCENSGIFHKVISSDKAFKQSKAKDKLSLFIKMFLYFITGQRSKFCTKMLNEHVNIDDFSSIVVPSSVGLISGACVALSKKKRVYILEDGTGDYAKRNKWIPINKLNSSYYWQGFILSKMGYCCPAWYYFPAEKRCIKYSLFPDKMNHNFYLEIRTLYSEENTDMDLFNSIEEKIYSEIADINFQKHQAILLTMPLSDNVKNVEPYQKRLQDYIKSNYDSIILKKHPRDQMQYEFGPNVQVTEISGSVPAEVVMPFVKNMDICVVYMSSTVMYSKAYNLRYKAIIFEGYHEESLSAGTNYLAPSEERVQSYYQDFVGSDFSIIKL